MIRARASRGSPSLRRDREAGNFERIIRGPQQGTARWSKSETGVEVPIAPRPVMVFKPSDILRGEAPGGDLVPMGVRVGCQPETPHTSPRGAPDGPELGKGLRGRKGPPPGPNPVDNTPTK